ncbi:glycoside hydrolase family 130 protein [Rubripirellula reticaptiva]|uniref:Beta-1,4-mannooligosaccharide phosphorylase n=1 Tax=Rubripirellula reticaptiva TaxID=2528013 RepID=A0A5C6EGZ0_9BACT|nr:glycosidase [Rubripirellula reticaptiva]TWU46866.1 Beta-1,4-mannooligosaccharide phosphorylase [Rubripirellula reticaptiva]
MNHFELTRLGLLMEPEPGNSHEVGGVLNPAAVRGPDGELYLFPRLVGKENYSRIGIARVQFDEAGDPCGVERLGVALEPEADYELQENGRGGCEDARITYVERFNRYLMTYTAFSRSGPRIALAVSEDLFHWKRLGLATFEPFRGTDFVGVANKDASLFPVAIPNHRGKLQLAMIHRPLFPGTLPEETDCDECARLVDLDHESIWISYCPMELDGLKPKHLGLFNSHHRLATPVEPWEALKIGGGTPPVMTRHGWMMLYHGVHAEEPSDASGKRLCYSAGVMILSKEHPRTILYRSAEPILTPIDPHERDGVVENVVFPTGIDCRTDIGQPDRFDIYYGMADSRIGVASMTVPQQLPTTTLPRVDAPNAIVPVVPLPAEATA